MRTLTKIIIPVITLTLFVDSLNFAELKKTKINPKKVLSRGVKFGKQKRYDEALKEFEKAISVYNKSSSKVYHNKGWALELKGNIPGAISSYEEAVKRNPVQIPSLERVGYLYFQTGKFEEAVSIGEKVINIDPQNQDVLKWLPEAYALRLKQQRDALLAKSEEKKRKKEEEKKANEKTGIAKEEKKEEEPPERYLYFSFDFMIRTAYYFRDYEEAKGYKYVTSPGAYSNVPEMININITPSKIIEFDLLIGNPYLGALSPNLLIHTEKFELITHLGKYSLGIGFMGNHYRSSFNYNGKNRALHDFKTGFIFSYMEDDATLRFTLYPRALPHDSEDSSGKTFDTDYAAFEYNYKVDKMLNYYSWMSARDYYFFDHEAEISNYWGVYEFGIGLALGKYKDIGEIIQYLSVSLDFTERFYMRDLNNENPYKFANGQGWFGISAETWFEGKPFPGYRAPGHVFTFKIEEGIIENIFFYQKFIFEMVDRREDHNEFNLALGIGGSF